MYEARKELTTFLGYLRSEEARSRVGDKLAELDGDRANRKPVSMREKYATHENMELRKKYEGKKVHSRTLDLHRR